MKTILVPFCLAAAVASAIAQAPAPAQPGTPVAGSDAKKAIEDFIAQGQAAPGAPATPPATPPTAPSAAGSGRQAAPGGATLPTPGARTPRQLPPGFPGTAANPAQNTVVPPGATTPPPNANVAGQVAPAGDANAQTRLDQPADDDMLVLGPGVTLDQLMEIYTELTGRIVLKGANVTAPQAIELNIPKGSLTRREMIQAIDTYLSLHAMTTVPMGEKFILLVPQADAPQQGGALVTAEAKDLPEASQFVTKIVHLDHIKPTELQQILATILKTPANSFVAVDSTQTLMLRDYAVNVKRALEFIKEIDVAVPVEYETELIPIKYALASDIGQVLGQLTTGGSVTSVGSSSGAGGFGGSFGAGGTGGLGAQTGIGGVGGVGGVGGIGTTGNRFNTQQARGGLNTGVGASAAGRSTFANRLNQLVNSVGGGGGPGQVQILGETKIIADERTNSLLIFANREDMETIKKIVAKMDVVLAQVLIESMILDVSLGDGQSISVSAARRDQTGDNEFASLMNNGLGFLNFAGATNISSIGNNAPAGFTWFGQFGDDLTVAINALAQQNRVKVLSRPSVQTSHAVPATLFVGETRPYITGSTFYGGDFSGASSRSQYQQLQIGLQLQILPLINPEGLVVMDIQQSIQQVAGSVSIDGNDVPITQDQNANAKVAVKDKDTIILGGFIQNTMSKNDSGVPFLKEIPLLGNLFKAKNRNDTRRELLVLIRPTVLPTPEDAAKLVQKRKDVTPNVKEAEVDFEIQEQEQLDRANEAIMKKRLGLPER